MRRFHRSMLAVSLCAVSVSGCGKDPYAGMEDTYRKEMEITRKAGLPVHAQDLKFQIPPPEQNAGPLYKQMMVAGRGIPSTPEDDELERKVYGRHLTTPEELAAAMPSLKRRAPLLRLAEEATSRDGLYIPRDYSLGPGVLFPEYATMRKGARLLSAESTRKLMQGDPLGAIRELELGLKMADQCSREPTLIAYLVSVAVDAITFSGYERILYIAGDKPGIAEAVAESIRKHWKPKRLSRAFEGEIVMQTVTMEAVSRKGLQYLKDSGLLSVDGNTPKPPDVNNWKTWVAANGVFMLRQSRDMAAAADRPIPEAIAEMERVGKELDKPENRDKTLAQMLSPVFTQVVVKKGNIEAQANVLRAAASILAYRRTHGRLPDSISQAVQPVPLDPFDGKPIRYRREGDGFVLYSVDKDGTFDGGPITEKPKNGEAMFRWPAPAWWKSSPFVKAAVAN